MFYAVQILSIPEFLSIKMNRFIKLFFIIILTTAYIMVFKNIYIDQNIGNTFPYKTIFGH